jgi:hypothetical protein
MSQQSAVSEATSPTDDTKAKNQVTEISQALGEDDDVLSWKPSFIMSIQGVAG